MDRSQWKRVIALVAVWSTPALAQTAKTAETGVRAIIPESLTLADAERLLIDRNLAVASNRELVAAAQAARQIASYKPNPAVPFGAEQFPFASPLAGTVPRFFSTDSNAGAQPTYTVQFQKMFERGGKREFRIEQADATLEAARFQVQDTLRAQLFQLRQAFATGLVARDNVRLAETILTQYERTEQLTVVRVQAGDFAAMELYRVRAGRLQYAQAVIDARNAYALATRDVLNILNAETAETPASGTPETPGTRPVSAASAGSDQPAAQLTAPLQLIGEFSNATVGKGLRELRALSLTSRPDVQLARQNLIAAEKAVELAKAQRSRDVSASVEYQKVGDDHSVGVITQVPLFLYNNQRSGIAQAEAQRRSAEALFRLSERQAITDVEKGYQSYIAAGQALALYNSENLNQVTRLQDIADFTFRQGNTSLFELLDVQRSTRQVLMAYNQARANYQLTLWQLELAVGAPIF
jgi:cobalt-zinc-cadmium efflux system outer membrane protein